MLPPPCPQILQLPSPSPHSCPSTSPNAQMSPIPYGRGADFLLQLNWGSRCKHYGPLHSLASPQRAWERQLHLPLPGLHLLSGCILKDRYAVISRVENCRIILTPISLSFNLHNPQIFMTKS